MKSTKIKAVKINDWNHIQYNCRGIILVYNKDRAKGYIRFSPDTYWTYYKVLCDSLNPRYFDDNLIKLINKLPKTYTYYIIRF